MAVERRIRNNRGITPKAEENMEYDDQDQDDIMKDLLGKTRQVGRVLQGRRDGEQLDYMKLAKLLTDFLAANVYILRTDGRILGHAWVEDYTSREITDFLKTGYMPERFVERLGMYRESEFNDNDAYMFDDDTSKKISKHLIYVPIYGAGAERLGTIVMTRIQEQFAAMDILLAEYVATLGGVEMLNDKNKSSEERTRDRTSVQMAMRALSYSEVESMKHIMGELGGQEGVAVASKVADRVGVTRSVIVNALRKLESAGLIESRSLGMKGTYIRVLSPLFVEELGTATSPRVNY